MTQHLDELWGRFDVDFPNDKTFLAMPARDELRGKAYLLLLGLSGWSVIHRTDGVIPNSIFAELAHRLWPDTPAGLLWETLKPARLMRRTATGYLLRKQAKWQRTRAEVEAAIEAGRRGASKRWGDQRVPHGEPQSSIGSPIGTPIAEQIKSKSKSKSKSRFNNPPSPPIQEVFPQVSQGTGRSGGLERIGDVLPRVAAVKAREAQ